MLTTVVKFVPNKPKSQLYQARSVFTTVVTNIPTWAFAVSSAPGKSPVNTCIQNLAALSTRSIIPPSSGAITPKNPTTCGTAAENAAAIVDVNVVINGPLA